MGLLDFVSCASVADCDAKRSAIERGEGYSAELSHQLSGPVEGDTVRGQMVWAGTSFETGACEGSIVDLQLIAKADGLLHLESRESVTVQYAKKDDACWSDDAVAAAEGQPCGTLQTIDGSKAQ